MGLSRRALLIESSQMQGQPDLPGARLDVQNWRAYLLSDAGGAWNDQEITVLSRPSWADLRVRLDLEATTDYVFMSFSGHGYHRRGDDIDESLICLTERDEVRVREVNPGNARCTFVIDACRQLVTDEELLERSIIAAMMVKSFALADRQRYRDLFDRAMQNGERGMIRLYSCDIDEAAGESRRSGGYYTSALIGCSVEWQENAAAGHAYYYPTDRAHNCATQRVSMRFPQQHAQYEGGRRNNHFPLAVKP
jgi:hypothetical protein